VRELERILAAQQARADECRGSVARQVGIHSGERRGERELRSVTEHSCCVRQRGGGCAGAIDPQRNAARDPVSAGLEHVPDVVGGRLEAVRNRCVEQCSEVEGVAGRRMVERGGERWARCDTEAFFDQALHRRQPQETRADERTVGLAQNLGHERGSLRLVGRSGRDDDEQRQVGETASKEGEPAERRLVCPVHVVDDQHRRRDRGQICGEPEEPMQDAEAGLGGAHRSGVEQRRGERGGTGEELCPHVVWYRGDRGLEQLAYDPERKLAFELAGPGAEHMEPGRLGERARLREEGRLPDAGAALERDEASPAGLRPVDDRLNRGELGVAFEQPAPDPRQAVRAHDSIYARERLGATRPQSSRKISSSCGGPSSGTRSWRRRAIASCHFALTSCAPR
jgi:hypothetical protein